jgi:hypothetical protein
MSKSLLKLIDASLIPAAVMICGKVLGLWLVNSIFKLNWGIITDANNFFSVKISYENQASQILASTYSNLTMYLSIFLGFMFILTKALYFHSSHISPSTIAKLATNNLLNLISNSFEIYYKASVWLIILWFSLLAVIINVFIGNSYLWSGVLCFICTISATIILLQDVYKEIEISRKNLPKILDANFKS